MRPDDFTPARRSRLIDIQESVQAFVPPPLPGAIELSPTTLLSLSRADRAIGALDGAGSWMPNPFLLIQPFIRREAVLSSRIEGTQASLTDLAAFEAAAPASRGLPSDVVEVANYVKALQMALDPNRALPVSLRFILDLHRELMTGVRGHEQRPGEFRTIQNFVGRPGSRIQDASYVPPPPREMTEALYAFEAWLHADNVLPPLVQLALTHYQFEAIHPFRDGNGRVGRLLIALLLVERRLTSQPLLYLSAYFEAHRGEYYQGLQRVSETGEWDPWVTFFADGVAEQAADAIVRAKSLLRLRERYHARLQTARASALPLKLVDSLFQSPVTTVVRAQTELGVTHRAASLIVGKLVDAGIIHEAIPELTRNRPFIAREIVDLLQAELPSEDRGLVSEQQTLDLA